MSTSIESEIRFFLPVDEVDWSQATHVSQIEEIHFQTGPVGVRLRMAVRDTRPTFALTFKFRTTGGVLETVIPTSPAVLSELFETAIRAGSRVLAKRRYVFPSNNAEGFRWEIDRYEPPFDFFCVVEHEYTRSFSMPELAPPLWFTGANWRHRAVDMSADSEFLVKLASSEITEQIQLEHELRNRLGQP